MGDNEEEIVLVMRDLIAQLRELNHALAVINERARLAERVPPLNRLVATVGSSRSEC